MLKNMKFYWLVLRLFKLIPCFKENIFYNHYPVEKISATLSRVVLVDWRELSLPTTMLN